MAAQEAETAKAPGHPRDETPNAPRVLVVDDNEANRALARDALEEEGYRVEVARDGVEALSAFAREAPDCVLLDVRMPGLDGFAVCERLRALPYGPEVPVLFLTAQRDIDTFDRAQLAGADDFLTKPVRPSELVLRVQAALKLRKLRAELQDHYGLLKRQRDDLLRLQLQKERLTAFVVHDLKNPVNALDLHAQLLLRDKALPNSAREAASHIRAEARQLTRMITNLLDLSKADEGRLTARSDELDFRALMSEVLAELELSAQARNVSLKHELGLERLMGDHDLLRRTLLNLLENAIRYAPAGSSVLVTADQSPHETLLRVADSGKGIPQALRETVFDPFVQVDAGDHPVARASRGLGLSFCKLAVEAHGGRIWIEDAAPGTIFCLRIPHVR